MSIHSPTNRQLRARTRRIVWFGARTVAHIIWWELIVRRGLGRAYVQRTATQRYSRLAREFRDLAVSMGGVLIKVGQFISSRVDVLPREVTDALADLQDEVPPERFEAIRAVVEAELGQPLPQAFAWFDDTVQAAASLGQTHRARLHNGETVIVKVQRPGITLIVDTDLAAVRTVLGWIKDYPPLRRRADVMALLDEFSRTLYQELDYLHEAENALRFATNFAGMSEVIVPRLYRQLSTRRVLVMEDVEAIKISDMAQLEQAGVDRVQVAQQLFATYLKQIFEDGFFHADPHPGNLFVHPIGEPHVRPRPFRLAFVDFGMTGQVAPGVRTQLRQALIGLSTRDTGRIVRAMDELGFFLPQADLRLVEKAMDQLFLRFYGITLTELRTLDLREIHSFIHQFRDLLFEMPIQVPHDYIYLGRTVSILLGMATSLDPNFNGWAAIQPYAEKLLAEEVTGGLADWLKQAGEFLNTLWRMPFMADRFLTRALADQLVVRIVPSREIENEVTAVVSSMNRLTRTVLLAALLVSGTLLIINHYEFWGTVLLVIAILGMMAGWLTGRR